MKTNYIAIVGMLAALIAGTAFQTFAQEATPASTRPDRAVEPSPTATKPPRSRGMEALRRSEQHKTQLQSISEADKAEIKDIFKGVDPNRYRLEFNGGKEVIGTKKISMSQLSQVRKMRSKGEETAEVLLATRDGGVMYVLVVSRPTVEDLRGILGQEKVLRLNQITAKYK